MTIDTDALRAIRKLREWLESEQHAEPNPDRFDLGFNYALACTNDKIDQLVAENAEQPS